MKMKLCSSPVLCLSLLLFIIPFSLAKGGGKGGGSRGGGSSKGGGGGGGWFGKGSSHKSSSTTHQDSGHAGTKTGHKSGKNHGGHPNSKQGQAGHNPKYPRWEVPGGYGGPGGYQGGYINRNPNNQIMSPHYGGSFGYGGYGTWGGSAFSHRVEEMGAYPSRRSRGFGPSASRAVADGLMTRMALGYGLGRFPRPHFHFHDSQQEYYYNHYMHNKHGSRSTGSQSTGSRSTGSSDHSWEQRSGPPPQTYESFMKSCMKRSDILPAKRQEPKTGPAETDKAAGVSPGSDSCAAANATRKESYNGTAAGGSGTCEASTLLPLNQTDAKPAPSASLVAGSMEDNDTVSIVEIGYPALIKQLHERRCLELYIDYTERHLSGRAEGLRAGFQGRLAVVLSTMLLLHDGNMLLLN